MTPLPPHRLLAAGLLLVLVPAARAGDPPLFPAAQDVAPSPMAAQDVRLADVDGDGVPDMLLAVTGGDRVDVRLGLGDGTFGLPVPAPAGDAPTALHVADLDGDGAADLVTVSFVSDQATVLLGAGDGTFTTSAPLPLGPSVGVSTLADLDGDGAADLVVTDGSDNSLRVALGHGDGTFAALTTTPLGVSPIDLVAADMDDDGDQDLALAVFATGEVHVLPGAGDGTFGAPTILPSFSSVVRALAAGDLDGDDRADLAVSGSAGVTVFRSQGDGMFAMTGPFPTGGSPDALAIAQIDGVGAPELLVADTALDGLVVLEGLGAGQFGPPTTVSTRAGPNLVRVADVDVDGALDVVVIASLGVTVFLGDGDGSLLESRLFPAGFWARDLAVADLDDDGALDAVTLDSLSSSGSVQVVLGAGDGTFAAPVGYAAGGFPRAVALADLDEDGVEDLLVMNQGDDDVSVHPGVGDGTFGPAVDFPAGPGPVDIFITDLDDDGHADVVLLDLTDDVFVLLGAGDGTLGAPTAVPTIGDPECLAVGDMDGDGSPDLVVGHGSFADDDISVHLNDGDGAFGAPWSVAVGGFFVSTQGLTVGDVDGDGTLDVVAAVSGMLATLPGNGDGTLGAPRMLSGPLGPLLLVTDLDDDGLADIVAGNSSEGDVSVFAGLGAGAFAPPVRFHVPGNVRAMVPADVDDDGHTDLLVAGSPTISSLPDGRGLSVLLNQTGEDPWSFLGQGLAGTAGLPVLVGQGTLVAESLTRLGLSEAAPSASAVMFAGFDQASLPFLGGTLVPAPDVILGGLATNAQGRLALEARWPSGLPAGTAVLFQCWVADAAAPEGFAASNGLRGVTP